MGRLVCCVDIHAHLLWTCVLKLFFLTSDDRISCSCLFPASWHFSLSAQVLPRLLIPSIRQLLFSGLVLCLIGLLYILLVSGKGYANWTGKENNFHRWNYSCCINSYNQLKHLFYFALLLLFKRHLARVTDVEATDTSNPNLNYGLVVDCGSSGSRVFVYCWPRHNGNPHELLDIRQMRDQNRKPVVMKIKPGKIPNVSDENVI